jgi:hypothetical protein
MIIKVQIVKSKGVNGKCLVWFLLSDQAQIRDMAGQIWKYMEEEVIDQLKSNLPWWLQELIADAGLQVLFQDL